ncbi:MAG: ABC transporter permease [Nitrospirae bacterium]|nr:MAG: ABC transporter permease [Nitrospirota bacterium]
MWTRILALVKKELIALLKDRKSRTVIIVPPIVQLLVFGYAATYDLTHIPFALYLEDSGMWGRVLAEHISGSPHFDLVSTITRDAEIAPLLDRKRALMVIRIGPQFSRELSRAGATAIQVLVDGRNSNTALLALSYIRTIVQQFNAQWAASQGLPLPPARLDIRPWFNPNLDSQWFIVPGIVGLLTMVVTILVTALSVAREREQGTFEQLLVTPLRPVEILLGKTLPGFLIGLGEATLIIIVARWWFQVPLVGDLPGLYLGLTLFLLSGLGVGLMISSLAVTQQQGLLGAFVFLVPAIILSGFATPIANMPVVVQQLTLFNPMRYFMVILRGVFLEGLPREVLVTQCWPMGLIGIVTLCIAGWLFRHRLS